MSARDRERNRRDLLRLTTAGSVDDGKSTLIGRLLADLGALSIDQLAALAAAAVREGREDIDLARVTDGLTAEREQGITIDVAYRYFATARRSFILADVPGHEQYTRNMVTGASKATAALFLTDVRNGMTRQSRRHVCIAALLGLPHVVFAVNKMDLVGYAEDAFMRAHDELARFCARLGFAEVHYVPVSAKKGENVVRGADAMPWYRGATLIQVLEDLPAGAPCRDLPFRMPVQLAARPADGMTADIRGYMGRVAAGRVRVGDRVRVAPGGGETTVTGILLPDGAAEEASTGQSATLTLADPLDVGRGHMLAAPEAPPREARELTATLCWLDRVPQDPRAAYLLRAGTRTVAARVAPPAHLIDVDTLDRVPGNGPLAANGIGEARIRLQDDIAFDPYAECAATGAFILIDPRTNATVAAGMVEHGL